MAITCSPADDNGASLVDGSGLMRIRLSFVVGSIEEEERYVSLLAYAGVQSIDSTVLAPDGDTPG
jgi:hypothetical protein